MQTQAHNNVTLDTLNAMTAGALVTFMKDEFNAEIKLDKKERVVKRAWAVVQSQPAATAEQETPTPESTPANEPAPAVVEVPQEAPAPAPTPEAPKEEPSSQPAPQPAKTPTPVGAKQALRAMFAEPNSSATVAEVFATGTEYAVKAALSDLKNPKYARGEVLIIIRIGDRYVRPVAHKAEAEVSAAA